MKVRTMLVFLAFCLWVLGSPARADEPPSAEEMMKAMMPGPAHQDLAKLAGDYTTKSSFRPAPDVEPVTSTGTAHLAMILDGRFLAEDNTAEMMGQPVTGKRLLGYNNSAKHYEGTWMYTMATGTMRLKGTSPDNGKTIDFEATVDDGKTTQKLQIIMKRIDDDHFNITLKSQSPEGGAGPSLTTEYTRKK
jgi:hypothetical protein